MTEFDVNELLFSFENEMVGTEKLVYQWLEDNVGPLKESSASVTNAVVFCGDGWQIGNRKYKDYDIMRKGVNVISWYLQIEDDQKAIMFALKWM